MTLTQEEFDKLYTAFKTGLEKEYWLIPIKRAMVVLGGAVVLAAVTVGGSWVGAWKAATFVVSSTAAKRATQAIEALHQQSITNAESIQKVCDSLKSNNLLRIGEAITVVPKSGAILFKVPGDAGHIQFEARGKILWYAPGGDPTAYHILTGPVP